MTSRGRLDPAEESQLNISPLDNLENRRSLLTLQEILETSFGPKGRTKVLHNNKGGQVTISSSCSRIINALSVSKPLVKLVTTAVQSHLSAFSDGGHLAALVALFIINSVLETDLTRRLATEVNTMLLRESLEYLKTDDCVGKVSVDISHIDQFLVLIDSILKSKPGCCLSDTNRSLLTKLILQSVLTKSMDSSLIIFPRSGVCPSESSLLPGLLIPAPQYPVFLKTGDLVHDLDGVPVMLISTSLSGDSQDYLDVDYEISSGVNIDQVTMDVIRDFVGGFSACGVKVVLCQKVIHPRIKTLLSRLGILAIDRLGKEKIIQTQQLCGGKLIGSFLGTLSSSDLGVIKVISHTVYDGASYLLLQGSDTVCTLVLCNWSEQALEETKHVCRVADHAVHQTMLSGCALDGGGSWQTHLARYLRSQSPAWTSEWSISLGCSPVHIQRITDIYCHSLEKFRNLVTEKSPLGRDFENKEETKGEILDCYQASVQALTLGVNLANTILGIHNCIEEK